MSSLTYLVTGCSRGLGFEFTEQLLKKGHTVWALSRNLEHPSLQKLQKEFPKTLFLESTDLEAPSEIKKFAERFSKHKVKLDVLINNAGVYLDGDHSLVDLPDDVILKSFTINTLGPLRMSRALLPFLKKGAKVIHITSLMGSIEDNSSGGYYSYRISKAALNMFSKSFSVDYPDYTSVVLHPGWVKTEMGGPQAPVEPHDSVKGLIQVIEKLTPKDSGSFFDYEGDQLPW